MGDTIFLSPVTPTVRPLEKLSGDNGAGGTRNVGPIKCCARHFKASCKVFERVRHDRGSVVPRLFMQDTARLCASGLGLCSRRISRLLFFNLGCISPSAGSARHQPHNWQNKTVSIRRLPFPHMHTDQDTASSHGGGAKRCRPGEGPRKTKPVWIRVCRRPRRKGSGQKWNNISKIR